jgi:hypothetical protein
VSAWSRERRRLAAAHDALTDAELTREASNQTFVEFLDWFAPRAAAAGVSRRPLIGKSPDYPGSHGEMQTGPATYSSDIDGWEVEVPSVAHPWSPDVYLVRPDGIVHRGHQLQCGIAGLTGPVWSDDPRPLSPVPVELLHELQARLTARLAVAQRPQGV